MKGIAVLAGALIAGFSNATTFTVHVFNFEFSTNPSGGAIVDPTINVGDTVRWVWDEGFHNVKSANNQFESWESDMSSTVGFTYDHTFTNAGSFEYYCEIHGFDAGDGHAGGMAGVVNVQAVPEPTSMAILGLGAAALIRRRRQA